MQFFKRSNVVDCMHKYCAYIKIIENETHLDLRCNYQTTNLFSNVKTYLLNHHIYKV
jgi:hypothetical protein